MLLLILPAVLFDISICHNRTGFEARASAVFLLLTSDFKLHNNASVQFS